MKKIKTIIRESYIRFISLIGFVCFIGFVCSCSKDDGFDELQNAAGVAIGGVKGYASYYEEDSQQTRSGEGLTRAWEIPTGYDPYENAAATIAVAFTQDGKNPTSTKGSIFKIDEEWRTSITKLDVGDYYLYGYVPNILDATFNITDYNGGSTDEEKNAEYSKGAIMNLVKVPSVMSNDLCVVVGAKQGTDKDHDSGLSIGDFSYRAVAITEDGGNGNFVFLLFDHLYAALRIRIRVYDDYAKLRTIKLKSLKLEPISDGPTTKKYNNISITLKQDPGNNPIVGDIEYVQTGEETVDGGMEFWSSDSGHELTTSFQPFIGHFMPNGITKLVLTSKYDVYDTKGNLIRENFETDNILTISELYTRQESTKRGWRYTVNMIIEPTYLYVLSEPDLDSPTMKLN